MMLYLLTPPAAEPVTVADAKLALRIDDTAFDALLPSLISSARQVAEQETGRAFIAQVWRAEFDDWPGSSDEIPVYRPTAAAVSYWDGAAWITLPTSGYVVAATARGTVLAPVLDASWPALGDVAIGPRVRIDLTAGVAEVDADTVPDCVKTFIVALVGQIVQTPELSASSAAQAHPLLARLLDAQRLWP